MLRTSNGNQVDGKVYSNGNEYDFTPHSNFGGCALVFCLAIVAVIIIAVIVHLS